MKFKIFILFFIIIGILMGIIVLNEYDNTNLIFKEGQEVYFLQQGAYKNIESMNSNTNNISNFIYFKDNNLYKVYVGITISDEISNKLKKLYNDRNIDIYIKKGTINNMSFVEKLKQYDSEIKNSDNEKYIFDIILQTLSEYKVVMEGEY